jgi:hypothetical protein
MCAIGGKGTLCGPNCDDFSRVEMLTLKAPALYPQSVFVSCDC